MRVKERAWLIPRVNEITKRYPQAELAAKLEAIGMPFAPIAKPWDLLDDPHLKASGGLLETRYMGKRSHIPALPIELDGKRLAKRSDPPRDRAARARAARRARLFRRSYRQARATRA